MLPHTDHDYKKLLTDLIKKEIVILGQDIVLAKTRGIKGLSVTDDGTVIGISGDYKEIINQIVGQFSTLSKPLVQKTIEPFLPDKSPFLAPQDKPLDTGHIHPRNKVHVPQPAQEITKVDTVSQKS